MQCRSFSVVCLTTLLFVSTAWGQSTGSNSTDTSTVTSSTTSTSTSSPSASDLRQTVKQEIRGSMAQVFVDMIQRVFTSLRALVGMSAASTDSTTDPLSILETALEKVVTEKVTGNSAEQ